MKKIKKSFDESKKVFIFALSFEANDDTKIIKVMSKFSLKAMIEAMEAGQTLEFTPTQTSRSTLSMYACVLGKELGREYYCRTIKGRGVYQITREA